jgi:glutamine synthetase
MKLDIPHYIEEAIAEHDKLAEALEKGYPGIKFASVRNLAAYIGERIIALYHSAKQKESEQCQQTTQPSA